MLFCFYFISLGFGGGGSGGSWTEWTDMAAIGQVWFLSAIEMVRPFPIRNILVSVLLLLIETKGKELKRKVDK